MQSEINLLRKIISRTLQDYKPEAPLSDKLVISNILHFSVAAYNRMVSALYHPALPPLNHLYDWASILDKMGAGNEKRFSYAEPEPVFPPEQDTGLPESENRDSEALF
jgi:hypothetical protein